ncbi:hypothetical protein B005_0688 [Nocardiopsis alba ATCC BAA-2165]|uniref:Uncharacterized protein n=1 Tax=Nocardiopsis alba (strain ATCC BAA-2165 / BE74) TaxID=1205910 RepID=J7LEB4_NOCAA|nr:hypothetical protein B005_0688 [Nocardiopsis alba ATCC BAA-2165]
MLYRITAAYDGGRRSGINRSMEFALHLSPSENAPFAR